MDSNFSHLDRLITAREAMHLLGIGSTTLYKFCRQGNLNPVKFSKRCSRFRLSEIHAFINSVQKGGAK
jgi:predicted DNA-binding transcriptional regulator AlpA